MKAFLFSCVIAFCAIPAFAQRIRYVNHTELGGLFGRVKYVNPNDQSQKMVDRKIDLTVQTFNGVKFNRNLSAGVTLGMDWYEAALLSPVSGGIRYVFGQKQKVGFLTSLDAGYGFAWFHEDIEGEKTIGGMMINPGVGLRIGQIDGVAFTIIMSYKRQEAKVEKQPLWNQIERSEDRVYNRLALKIGIEF